MRLSHQLERRTEEDRRLAQHRADTRRDKEKHARSYEDLGAAWRQWAARVEALEWSIVDEAFAPLGGA